MASSGAMKAQTFSYIIPRSQVMAIGPCKKETRSNSKLFRDRKVPRPPTSQRLLVEAVGNYPAGRDAPPAGLFYLESIWARGHCVNGAYSVSLAALDKLWDDWVS